MVNSHITECVVKMIREGGRAGGNEIPMICQGDTTVAGGEDCGTSLNVLKLIRQSPSGLGVPLVSSMEL